MPETSTIYILDKSFGIICCFGFMIRLHKNHDFGTRARRALALFHRFWAAWHHYVSTTRPLWVQFKTRQILWVPSFCSDGDWDSLSPAMKLRLQGTCEGLPSNLIPTANKVAFRPKSLRRTPCQWFSHCLVPCVLRSAGSVFLSDSRVPSDKIPFVARSCVCFRLMQPLNPTKSKFDL